MKKWSSGGVEQWRSGAVEEWSSGGVEQWSNGAVDAHWSMFTSTFMTLPPPRASSIPF
jgi:hypothetical protein